MERSAKSMFVSQSGIPASSQLLLFNGNPLSDDSKTLADHSIGSDDVIMLTAMVGSQGGGSGSRRRPAAAPQGNSAGGQGDGVPDAIAEELRRQLLGNPQAMAQLRATQPQIADAVSNGDTALFKQFLEAQRNAMASSTSTEERMMAELAAADPFDAEAQARIEEAIRQERVMENLEHAMEYSPESFGRVTMLYVDTQVNGSNVKAFVDSGAQATIMSPECAERCGIMRLIDKRFAGIARGVGTAKILGRVHSAQIRLGEKLFLPCSFTIMEGKGVELLFGLDMLKRFQAVIDLKQNALLVGDEIIRFLDEHELPAHARADNAGEDEAEQSQDQQAGSSSSIPVSEAAKLNAQAAAGSAARTGPFPGHGQSLESGGNAGSTSTSAPGSNISFEHRPGGSPSGQGQTAGASARSGSASTAPPSTANYPPASIKSLTDLGATDTQAKQLLDAAGGNVEVAASLLFQQ